MGQARALTLNVTDPQLFGETSTTIQTRILTALCHTTSQMGIPLHG